MAGGKRQRGNHGGGRFAKKPKRSKQFWQQRKTVGVAPIPRNESSEEDISSSENEEDNKTHFDKLLSAFSSGSGKNGSNPLDSSEEDDSQSDDDSDVDDSDAEDDHAVASQGEEESEECDEPEVEGERKIEMDDQEEESEEDVEDEEDVDNNDLEASDDGSSSDEDDESTNPDLCGSAKDPFVARHELKIEDSLVEVIKSRKFDVDVVRWKNIGRISVMTPDWTPETKEKQKKKLVDDDDDEDNDDVRNSQIDLITKRVEPALTDGKLEKQFVKAQLAKNVAPANVKNLTDTKHHFTPLQQELFSILNSYRDLNFTQRSHDNSEEIRLVYTLHSLNHILKTRTRIINNNARLSKSIKEKKKKLADAASLRDQGLVRPKVLIVLPFRESARRVVEIMIKLLFSKDSNRGTIMKKKRFDDEFGSGDDVIDGEVPVATGRKSEDYYKTFAGNSDDGFKLGIAVTKKSLKLFTDFYSSDMVIASPLGLRMVLENDADFLASVELLVMDQVDIFAMQNWEHVTFIMEKLHQRPTKSHGVDFSRVRLWTLDELSTLYCQSLFFSSVPMVELNAIFNRTCKNYLGKMVTVNQIKTGSISGVLVGGVPMTFHRVDTKNLATSVDDRFNYFVQKVMPEFKKDLMYHTLVFVPSYFDFVRLRNWFHKSDLDFGDICEYTKDKRIAEYRDQFFHGEKHFLIYTERSHFYRRFAIKGIRHLIFYQLPQNPSFYSELCNFMQPAFLNRKGGSDGNMSCTVLYTKYDNLRLASVASTSKAEFMMSAEKNIHLFMAGN